MSTETLSHGKVMHFSSHVFTTDEDIAIITESSRITVRLLVITQRYFTTLSGKGRGGGALHDSLFLFSSRGKWTFHQVATNVAIYEHLLVVFPSIPFHTISLSNSYYSSSHATQKIRRTSTKEQ